MSGQESKPVQLQGVGDYPFLLDWVPAQASLAASAPVSPPADNQAAMTGLLYRARRYFWQASWSAAENMYRLLFSYYKRFGAWSGELRDTYFAALLEYGWVLVLQGREQEAERLFSEQLAARLKTLAPDPKTRPADRRVAEVVASLQHQGKLPHAHAPEVRPDPETLTWLGKRLAAENHGRLAGDMLRFAQVAYGLRQMETAQLAWRIEHGNAPMASPTPQQIIRTIPALQWLHYAPTQGPFPYDYQRAAAHYEQPPDEWVPPVNPAANPRFRP